MALNARTWTPTDGWYMQPAINERGCAIISNAIRVTVLGDSWTDCYWLYEARPATPTIRLTEIRNLLLRQSGGHGGMV